MAKHKGQEISSFPPAEDSDPDPAGNRDTISPALEERWGKRLSPKLTATLLSYGVTSEQTENTIDSIRDFYNGDTAQAFRMEHIIERVLVRGQSLPDLLETRPGGLIHDKSVAMAPLVLALAVLVFSFGCASANDRAKVVLVSAGETWSHVRDAHEEAGKLLYQAGKECQDAVKAKPGGTDLPPVTAANVGAVMAQCKDAGKPLPFDPVKFNGMVDTLSKARGAIWQGNEFRQKLANANGDQSAVWVAIADAVAYLAQTYLIGKELGFQLEQGDLVSLQKAATKR